MEIHRLSNEIEGSIVKLSDAAYDESRSIYNAMIDKRPKLFVKCQTKHDVVKAIQFARENALEVSVKGGGHNMAGLSLAENGLVIDLSEMKSIEIHPDKKIAIVGPGNTLSDIDKVTHQHGLALPMGVNGYTGISGLTLGGGLGFLTRKAGLTIDHLIEANLVLASGEIVTANCTQHQDLYWAIRGGGGNFGVVVSFTFRLLPIKNVYAGPMFWPLENASEVMRFYDSFTKDASHDMYGFFAFLTVPDVGDFPEHLRRKKVCGIVWCYTGPTESIEQAFKPIRAFGPPILDFVSEIPLPKLNSLFDWLYPPGLYWYWKGHYINELSEACISDHIRFANTLPTPRSTMHLYPIDGKAHEVGQSHTAWAHRNVRWAQVIIGVSENAPDENILRKWTKEYYDAMTPHSSGGGYVNFMMNETDSRVRESYGSNFEKLSLIKRKYDPDNFFHLNQNIKPTPKG